MKRHIIVWVTALMITALAGCSYENTATVTIDTGIRTQAQLSVFDRVLALISMSKSLKADPVPGQLYISSIEIKVWAQDMGTITKSIPLETGRITIEVPAGSQRTFEVVAYQGGEVAAPVRLYGGIRTVDLSPGQQVDLNIVMGELVNLGYAFSYDSQNQIITLYDNLDRNPIAFHIYRMVSGTLTGPIVINNFTTSCSEGCNYDFYYDLGSDVCGESAVYISGVNQYGESDRVISNSCI